MLLRKISRAGQYQSIKNIPSRRNQTQLKILTHRKKTSQKNPEMKKIPKSGNNSVNIVARAPA